MARPCLLPSNTAVSLAVSRCGNIMAKPCHVPARLLWRNAGIADSLDGLVAGSIGRRYQASPAQCSAASDLNDCLLRPMCQATAPSLACPHIRGNAETVPRALPSRLTRDKFPRAIHC
jgi:hypothetical protein